MSKEDDLAIHRYSRLLGLQKKKAKIPKVFKNDGLDGKPSFLINKIFKLEWNLFL